jgi:hypothetical protein
MRAVSDGENFKGDYSYYSLLNLCVYICKLLQSGYFIARLHMYLRWRETNLRTFIIKLHATGRHILA